MDAKTAADHSIKKEKDPTPYQLNCRGFDCSMQINIVVVRCGLFTNDLLKNMMKQFTTFFGRINVR